MKSYTSSKMGITARLGELVNLYQRQASDIPERVRTLVSRLRAVEARVLEQTGVELRGLKMLDIGPGQSLYQMAYFAGQGNDVIGIDLDVIAQGMSPADFLKMVKVNGPVRAVKSAGRKLLGIDNRFRQELSEQLKAPPPGRLDVRQMDATRLEFEPATFDAVYSFSTFEHLPEPAKVLDEVVRVLKPGGVAYLCLHLFTSENGGHDPRIFANRREGIPFWSHLRPQHQDKTTSNAYLNKIRIDPWKEIFREKLPGAQFYELQYARDQLMPELRKLREAGELADYTDAELMTVDFVALWKKPA